MVAKRRLGDLWVVGKPLTFDDGKGPVTVWLQKLNPIEEEEVIRRASAKRAKDLRLAHDHDSEEWKLCESDLLEFTDRASRVDIAIRDELIGRQMRIEAELSAEEEWAKDGYLQGLVDLWEGTDDSPGLKERFLTEPEDPDVVRVKSELDRFNDRAEAEVEKERAALRRDWDSNSDDELLAKCVEVIMERRATDTLMSEYELWQIYYGVRDPDHRSERYFVSGDEVRAIDPKTRKALLDHYRTLMVEHTEGKDSEETPVSSPSSELSVPEETGDSSGLVAAPG